MQGIFSRRREIVSDPKTGNIRNGTKLSDWPERVPGGPIAFPKSVKQPLRIRLPIWLPGREKTTPPVSAIFPSSRPPAFEWFIYDEHRAEARVFANAFCPRGGWRPLAWCPTKPP